MSQKHIYLLWCLVCYLADFFSTVLMIDKFESIKEKRKVYFKYEGEKEFRNLGKYILLDKSNNTFIVQSSSKYYKGKNYNEEDCRYINYLVGEYVKPTKNFKEEIQNEEI